MMVASSCIFGFWSLSVLCCFVFFFNDTATTEIYTLSLHDALPICEVLVNEIAPRTHNSGHFSIDACYTSQFEQHLRVVCDLPLGNVAMKIPCAIMVNLLGYETRKSDYIDKRSKLAKIPGAHVHWYGKSESRPGRKLGHITVLFDKLNRDEAMTIAKNIESVWYCE